MKRAPNPYSEAEVRRAIQANIVITDQHDSKFDVIDDEISDIDGDIVVIDGRLDDLEASGSISAQAEVAIAIGQPVYIKSNTHADLAYSNDATASKMIGLALTSAGAGFSVKYITDGKITLADWSAVLGTTNLTPGADYYLGIYDTSVVPSYSNPGGMGDRTASITVSETMTYHFPTGANGYTLVDGKKDQFALYFSAVDVTGKYIRFDFATWKRITEALWSQDATQTHGTWKWQGSDNASSWTDIGASFTLGGSTAQTITTLSANILAYRYYQLIGVSGTASDSPWLREVEFKIANSGVSYPGMLTANPPTSVGVYLVRVGRAASTVILNVEIEPSILL